MAGHCDYCYGYRYGPGSYKYSSRYKQEAAVFVHGVISLPQEVLVMDAETIAPPSTV